MKTDMQEIIARAVRDAADHLRDDGNETREIEIALRSMFIDCDDDDNSKNVMLRCPGLAGVSVDPNGFAEDEDWVPPQSIIAMIHRCWDAEVDRLNIGVEGPLPMGETESRRKPGEARDLVGGDPRRPGETHRVGCRLRSPMHRPDFPRPPDRGRTPGPEIHRGYNPRESMSKNKNKSFRERFREVLPTIDVDRDHDPEAIIAATRDRSPDFLAHAWAACIEAAELSEDEVRYQMSHPFPVLAGIGDPRIPRVIELLTHND